MLRNNVVGVLCRAGHKQQLAQQSDTVLRGQHVYDWPITTKYCAKTTFTLKGE